MAGPAVRIQDGSASNVVTQHRRPKPRRQSRGPLVDAAYAEKGSQMGAKQWRRSLLRLGLWSSCALGAALLLVGPQALWAQDDTADSPVSTSAAGGSQMLRSTRAGQRVTVDSLARDSVQANTFAFDQ